MDPEPPDEWTLVYCRKAKNLILMEEYKETKDYQEMKDYKETKDYKDDKPITHEFGTALIIMPDEEGARNAEATLTNV